MFYNIVIKEGDPVPKFSLQDENGKTIRSTDYNGKKYVIYFYPKDFTPGCTVEADEFSKDYKNFQKERIDIIGISKDDVESHKKFCEKMKIPYTLLSDTDAQVTKKFGVWGKKNFMGKEYMGVIRSTFLVNEKGTVFKVFPKVKPAGHSKEVLACFKN